MSRQLVALIRHGAYHQLADTPSASQPFPLTESGIQHARQSATAVRQFSQQERVAIDDTIHCSTLLRAWQTASVIAQQLDNHPTLQESDQLAERSVGSVANLSVATIEQLIESDPRYEPLPDNWKSTSQFRLPFPGAESLLEAGERVASYIKQVVEPLLDTESALHLLVGHGAAFRHAAYHLGVLPLAAVATISMYHNQPVFLQVDGQREWRSAGGRWRPRQLSTQEID
ncbi:MAG: histidine phosphatase family protein [Mariprofundales bacterium]|nr:histidine phosphatase family protein [Mariprofundales bacterium]